MTNLNPSFQTLVTLSLAFTHTYTHTERPFKKPGISYHVPDCVRGNIINQMQTSLWDLWSSKV